MGRVPLQSQNEVWGAAPGRETGTGKSKVVAPLRVHLGKRNTEACAASRAWATDLPRGWHLPPDPPAASEPGPAPGGLPVRRLLGSLAKDLGQGSVGEWRRRLPPGPWLDAGLPEGAQQVLSACCSPSLLLPMSGAPTPPLSVEPLPSLGRVRGREVCKLGSGQAARVRTPTLPPFPPQTPHL